MTEYIHISEMPINKWVNVIVRAEQQNRCFCKWNNSKKTSIEGVPRQNYDDVHMSANGGFDGNTSNLWYYNYAIGMTEIQSFKKWTNMTLLDETMSGSN